MLEYLLPLLLSRFTPHLTSSQAAVDKIASDAIHAVALLEERATFLGFVSAVELLILS